MKKTISINIAGQLFRLDEDAFEILTRYLGHVSARFSNEPGGEETVADIELRIAEIFGGGNEPPLLVSKEMVEEMITIMGAPEEYYDDTSSAERTEPLTRKEMYDPNSLSARTGRALSDFFRGFGRLMSGIIRVFSVILGSLFAIFGFTMLFLFVFILFFHNAPFMTGVIEPDMTNINMLLRIVLNQSNVIPVIILASIVILFPLAGLTWLGIKLIFRIRERFRIFSIVMFVTWIASLCALSVILGLQLSVYADTERVEERKLLSDPPDTLWVAPLKRVSDLRYDDKASADWFAFYSDSQSGRLYGTSDLNIYCSDTTKGWISVEKRSCDSSDPEAYRRAREIEFSWRFSSDTLYLDEYFGLPSGESWNGSQVDIDVSLPEGTVVKVLPGSEMPYRWMLWSHNPDATLFTVTGRGMQDIE